MDRKTEKPELIQRLLELASKPGKIFLQTGTLIVAYFIFLLFRAIYIGIGTGVLANIFLYIGEIIAYFVILFGMTAVANITLGELRNEGEIPGRQALGAAFGRIKDIISSPLKIFGILAGLVVIHGIIDLLGSVPFIGELGWMFSPIFTFPLGIAMIAVILILIFGAMILPTIIILGKEGPVSELIDFMRKHTLKFGGHFLIALVVAVIMLVVLNIAIDLSNGISHNVMGRKYTYIRSHIPGWLQHVPRAQGLSVVRAQPLAGVFARIGGGRSQDKEILQARYRKLDNKLDQTTDAGDRAVIKEQLKGIYSQLKQYRWTLYLAGFVFGIIMWLIHMGIWGFILVNFSVAGTLSYISLTGEGGEPEDGAVVIEEEGEKEEEKEKAPPKKKAPKTAEKSAAKPKKKSESAKKPDKIDKEKKKKEEEEEETKEDKKEDKPEK